MKSGEVFTLAADLPYKKNELYRTIITNNDSMKFVIAVMDAGTSFPKQPTVGKAMIFALDGEAYVGYDGQEHLIHVGQHFLMEKGVDHYVRAKTPFKMAVVVDLTA